MRFRKLRIAFSATCLIACLLLIVLWVRSYWKSDEIRYISFAKGHIYSSYSSYGVLTLSYGTDARFQSLGRRPRWRISSQGHDYPGLSEEAKTNARKGESKQFLWSNRLPSSFSAKAPYWLITLLIVASGVVPLLRWRFSLRTLLITITLLAIMLGVIVYLFRQSDTKPAEAPPSPWLF